MNRLPFLLLSPALLLGAGPFNEADHPSDAVVLHPDARGREAPDRSFDVRALHLDLDLDPAARAVAGTATYTVARLGPGPLVLDQVELDIEGVTVDGQPATWRVAGDTLSIELASGRGTTATVAVRYRATPRTGLHFRGTESDTFPHVYSQGEDDDNRYWFPAWDHPNDRFSYTGQVRGPAGWKVMTNPADDLVTYLVMLAAGPYEELGEGLNSVWVPPGTPKVAVDRVMEPIPGMMEHFAARTGVAYPWGTYRQVFVERFLFTGMENTSATIQDRRLLTPASMSGTSRWVESVVAHELAHQWFGDLLTCRSWRELWLNEGFATFMANDWMGTRYGEDDQASHVRGFFKASQDGPPLAGRFHQGPAAPDNGRVYMKGASVLHMLRVMLGEDAFWAGVRRYVAEHQRGLVDTADLQAAMEDESGQELGWFFQQWVELPFVPELTVRSRWADGRATVTVRQGNGPKKPAYTLPITVEFGTPDGPVRRSGWLDDGELELSLDLAAPPAYTAFDPDLGVLAEVDQEQDPAAWQAQLNSPSAFARLAALEALGQTDRSDPLVQVLTDRGRPSALRQAAAAALGEQRAVAPLVAALQDADDEVRLSAAEALGKTSGAEAAAALRDLLRREPNPDVAAGALAALGPVDPDAAVVEARRAIRQTAREAEPLRHTAAAVLGDHGDAKDLALLLDPKLRCVRRGSMLWAAVRLANREPEGPAREAALARVARSAEAMLSDADLRGRENAVAILGEVGDQQSVAKLESFRRQEEVRDLQDAVGDALDRIRSRAGQAPKSRNEEEARVEALEKRLDEMEREMRKMRDRH